MFMMSLIKFSSSFLSPRLKEPKMKKFSAKNSASKSFVCTVAKTATTNYLQLACVEKINPRKVTKAAKKSTVSNTRKLVKAQCPVSSDILVLQPTLDNLCATVTCDATANIQSINIERVLVEPEQTLILPFDAVSTHLLTSLAPLLRQVPIH